MQEDLESTEGEVNYGEEVLSISHVKSECDAAIRLVRVTSREVKSGRLHERLARNLIISTGGSPRLPMELQDPDLLATGRVLHSSEFLTRIDHLLDNLVSRHRPTDRPIRLAVLGGGQSASEIFLSLRNRIAERTQPGESGSRRPQIEMYLRRVRLNFTCMLCTDY